MWNKGGNKGLPADAVPWDVAQGVNAMGQGRMLPGGAGALASQRYGWIATMFLVLLHKRYGWIATMFFLVPVTKDGWIATIFSWLDSQTSLQDQTTGGSSSWCLTSWTASGDVLGNQTGPPQSMADNQSELNQEAEASSRELGQSGNLVEASYSKWWWGRKTKKK